MKVTIGGDRLGSGNKIKTNLTNYDRSTHDLTQKWTSSMTVGALYPFLVIPAMRGDKFTIDLDAAARTIPTQGPLYGSFKMQLDIFQCPVRLYQAVLHNNPLKIGLNMSDVLFPQVVCRTRARKNDRYTPMKFSSSCLMKYLGVSGIGRYVPSSNDGDYKDVSRKFNAIPMLAYYDIFKTYYSNKQEDNAYVIAPKKIAEEAHFEIWKSVTDEEKNPYEDIFFEEIYGEEVILTGAIRFDKEITLGEFKEKVKLIFEGINTDNEYDGENILTFQEIDNNLSTVEFYKQLNEPFASDEDKSNLFIYRMKNDFGDYAGLLIGAQGSVTKIGYRPYIEGWGTIYAAETTTELELKSFALENIDDMRLQLLSYANLGTEFMIIDTESESGIWGKDSGQDNSGLPYVLNSSNDTSNKYPKNSLPLNGLVVKTYQSDIFNCWVNTEWIDGENGIAAITAVSTSDGKFTMDSLNLAEKLYDMLNRIAVSDGTYESWQDTVYTDSPKRHIESPIYLGGMSTEVVFEEIVQTTPTENEPLGNMGGRGVLVKRKGGHVVVNVSEASFIIGIVSLTPRINYTQGNEFYMTELKSMDDFHKPALDGIGFQNLMAERAAWFGTGITGTSESSLTKEVIGKIPAWLEYMTAVDKAYGDFAEDEGKSFMVLNRNYEHLPNGGGISDATTYIDPTKYNYAFAVKSLDAQNFWVQIKSKVTARRLMSAKQIPNL